MPLEGINLTEWSEFGALVVLGVAGLKYLSTRDELARKQQVEFTDRMEALGHECHTTTKGIVDRFMDASEKHTEQEKALVVAVTQLTTEVRELRQLRSKSD